MNKKFINLFLLSTLFIAQTCWGLALEIIPQGNLPTGIVPGETLYAYYTIQNNTGKTQTVLVDLPNGVEQNTTPQYEGLSLCQQAPFTITTSCVLKLQVTAPVAANQEITVCLDDGATCTHTSSHDNNALVVNEKTAQFFFTIDAETGGAGVFSCLLSADGSTFVRCEPSIEAATFTNPYDVIINQNTNPPTAYVANSAVKDNSSTIFVCSVLNEGQMWNLENCQSFTDESFGTSLVGLQLSPDSKRLYITSPVSTVVLKSAGKGIPGIRSVSNSIIFCNINDDGTLISPCVAGLGEEAAPKSIWITGATAYMADHGLVSICTIDTADNTIENCINSELFTTAEDIITNSDGTLAYIVSSIKVLESASISICSISANDGSLGNCATYPQAAFDFNGAGLQISPDGDWLYVTDYDNSDIAVCNINGSFSCSSNNENPYSGPKGRIAFMTQDGSTYAYIADNEYGNLWYCDYAADTGTLCGTDSGDLQLLPTSTYPLSVAADGSYLYLSASPASGVLALYGCDVDNFPAPTCYASTDNNSALQFPHSPAVSNLAVVNNGGNTVAYVPSGLDNSVLICPIAVVANGGSYEFTTYCDVWTALSPFGRVAFATFGGQDYLYAADYVTGNIIRCEVEADGTFSVCAELITGIGNDNENLNLLSLDFNAANSALNISTYDSSAGYSGAVYYCYLDALGYIKGSCLENPWSTFLDFSSTPANLFTRNSNNFYYLPNAYSEYISICDPSFINCSLNQELSTYHPGSAWTVRF